MEKENGSVDRVISAKTPRLWTGERNRKKHPSRRRRILEIEEEQSPRKIPATNKTSRKKEKA